GISMQKLRSPGKNRKRGGGGSSSSSSSSIIRSCKSNNRVGKDRSETLFPIWGTTPLRSFMNSPNVNSQSGKSTRGPVSARKLAATLWELSEIPTAETGSSQQHKRNGGGGKKEEFRGRGHLLDPSHSSPTRSEKMEMGCHQRAPLISERLRLEDQNDAVFDSISQSSLVQVIEDQPAISIHGGGGGGGFNSKNKLKDISNALTTSKELLKIISRLWVCADQSSSHLSVISALHAELERARLQVNHLIRDPPEKQRHRAIEAAVRAVSNELESERKLRRRLESLNKKLGNELVEIKSSFIETVKELQNEKRTREITEQMCDELVRNADGEAVVVRGNGENPKAAKTRNHRTEAKNSSAIRRLKKQLEGFLGGAANKRDDEDKNNDNAASNHISGRTPSLQRSVSDGVE
ncbi:hypothetical protein M569_09099, partial [Genlisea aurea]